MRSNFGRNALFCIALAIALASVSGSPSFHREGSPTEFEPELQRAGGTKSAAPPPTAPLRSRADLAIGPVSDPRSPASDLATQPIVAQRETWWSRALGRDADDPALVSNSDDRILVAVAAGWLESRDLRALEDLIAANGLGEGSSPYDRNDGDGLLSAWEFGFQVWQDGRLVALSLGPDPHSSFRYDVEVLPESVEDLDGLRYLGLAQNQLRELPAGLGRLGRLEQLIASENRLTTLPESIGGLRSLERLVLSDNLLESLPESIAGLEALAALHLADNPFLSLPDGLASLDRLRTLDLSRSGARAQRPGPLVPAVLEIATLEEVYAAGHPSLCGAIGSRASQLSLADGSSVLVYGASHPMGCAPR